MRHIMKETWKLYNKIVVFFFFFMSNNKIVIYKLDNTHRETSKWFNLQTLTGAMLKVETLISNNRFAISLFNPEAKSYKYEEKKNY